MFGASATTVANLGKLAREIISHRAKELCDRFHRSPLHGIMQEASGRSVPEPPVTKTAAGTTSLSGRCQAVMLSRLLFNAAVVESSADSAATADVADTVAAATAVAANAAALPVPPDNTGFGGGPIVMVWLIALLAPLIALILVVLVGEGSILPRDAERVHRKDGYGSLINP